MTDTESSSTTELLVNDGLCCFCIKKNCDVSWSSRKSVEPSQEKILEEQKVFAHSFCIELASNRFSSIHFSNLRLQHDDDLTNLPFIVHAS